MQSTRQPAAEASSRAGPASSGADVEHAVLGPDSREPEQLA